MIPLGGAGPQGHVRWLNRLALRLASAAIAIAPASAAIAAGPTACKLVRIAEWPVRLERNQPIVDGSINGQKIGVLLATGTSSSLILRSAATRLGLTLNEVRGLWVGGGGETHVEMAYVDDLAIGGATRKNWQALVAGERDMERNVALILGNDFFENVDLEFDLPHKTVRLFQAKDCNGAMLAYWSKGNAGEATMEAGPKTVIKVQLNGRPLDALLDSGATGSVLALPYARDLGLAPGSPGMIDGGCLSGIVSGRSVESWIASFATFAMGNEVVHNPKIVVADLFSRYTYAETGSRLPQSLENLPGMLLGIDFLRAHRLLIAASQRKVFFTYEGGPAFAATPGKPCGDQSATPGGGG